MAYISDGYAVLCFLSIPVAFLRGGDPAKMATARLTKRTLEGLRPREQRYTVYDSDVRGFGVRVQPSGKRSWIFEYRPGEGGRNVAKRRVTIGDAKALTPEQARRRAETLRAQTRLGQDPQAEKAA